MERTKVYFATIVSLSLALLFFTASAVRAQIDVGNYSISGSAEVGGMFRGMNGADARFQEYRDLPESVIVPQLQLMIGGKKDDFYLNFDSSKVGLDDQNYMLRFGRYGLLDVEFEWDQIPHLFSRGIARTPYSKESNGIFTLSSKPANTTPPGAAQSCSASAVCNWVDSNANPIDLKLLDGFGKLKLRYTPTPGWTFTGNYWSMNSVGKRAIGAYFGSSPGNYAITELPEPIDYQSHNVELGGEYAGKGWSVGLKYNMSLFHNNVSTMVWDNPSNTSGAGSACTETATTSASSNGSDANRGPCRGRYDLYPSNQAHTWTLTGTTALPLKTQFMGTASYGMRLQNDPFLPFTINSAVIQPSRPRDSLDGDMRPTMINLTLVNRYFDHLDLKGYYRYYDLDNRSKKIDFAGGIIISDQGSAADAGAENERYAYSKQNMGLDATYDYNRWLSAKLSYGLEAMHRELREVTNSDEHSLGPTVDIKPWSWVLVRASYKRFWRNAHYDANRVDATLDPANITRKFDEAERNRDKTSLFTQITPWEKLTLHGGFDFIHDDFPNTLLGIQRDSNYSPSIGLIYMPLDWVKLFADYNWERFDWKMEAMQRTARTQTPQTDPNRVWFSRGKDEINTMSIGSDLDLIQKILGFRLQYGYSLGRSEVRASGNSLGASGAMATNYPTITNTWHELLARMEYRVHKNIALNFGYYFNHATEHDIGVDMMRVWMGNREQYSAGGNNNLNRSIFLGDRIKGAFTSHVGFLSMRLSF